MNAGGRRIVNHGGAVLSVRRKHIFLGRRARRTIQVLFA
jgi:hypothetical protein